MMKKAAKVWRKIWEENKAMKLKREEGGKEVVEMLKRIQPALGLKTMRVACSI